MKCAWIQGDWEKLDAGVFCDTPNSVFSKQRSRRVHFINHSRWLVSKTGQPEYGEITMLNILWKSVDSIARGQTDGGFYACGSWKVWTSIWRHPGLQGNRDTIPWKRNCKATVVFKWKPGIVHTTLCINLTGYWYHGFTVTRGGAGWQASFILRKSLWYRFDGL